MALEATTTATTATTTATTTTTMLRSSAVPLGWNSVVAAPPPLDLSRARKGTLVDKEGRRLLEPGNDDDFYFDDNDNDDNDNDDNDDDESNLSFYDLYQSPCRGVLRASNDELLDYVDLGQMNDDAERNHIISYNSGSAATTMSQQQQKSLYQNYFYYFDDMDYCGSTFYGGCRFPTETSLLDRIGNEEAAEEEEEDGGDDNNNSDSDNNESFVDWTVVYDYEIHYIDPSSTQTNNEDQEGEGDGEEEGEAISTERQRGDPIPAVRYLETIVLEHLGEVLGLSRKQCAAQTKNVRSTTTTTTSTTSTTTTSTTTSSTSTGYHHDFSEDQLEQLMAISSDPSDVLDPDHANCIVPVPSSIAETTDCMPVTGAIRVYLNTTGMAAKDNNTTLEETKLAIQSGFQRLIRFGMQQGLYLTEETDDDEVEKNSVVVKHVSFIGTRVPGDDDSSSFDGTFSNQDQQTELGIATGNNNDDNDNDDDDNDDNGNNKKIPPPTSVAVLITDASGNGTAPENNKNVASIVLATLGLVMLALFLSLRSTSSEKPKESQEELVDDVEQGNCDLELELELPDSESAKSPALSDAETAVVLPIVGGALSNIDEQCSDFSVSSDQSVASADDGGEPLPEADSVNEHTYHDLMASTEDLAMSDLKDALLLSIAASDEDDDHVVAVASSSSAEETEERENEGEDEDEDEDEEMDSQARAAANE